MAEPVVDQSGIELQEGGSPTLPSSTPSPSKPVSMRTPSFTNDQVLRDEEKLDLLKKQLDAGRIPLALYEKKVEEVLERMLGTDKASTPRRHARKWLLQLVRTPRATLARKPPAGALASNPASPLRPPSAKRMSLNVTSVSAVTGRLSVTPRGSTTYDADGADDASPSRVGHHRFSATWSPRLSTGAI